jgi:hypothetical protein
MGSDGGLRKLMIIHMPDVNVKSRLYNKNVIFLYGSRVDNYK